MLSARPSLTCGDLVGSEVLETPGQRLPEWDPGTLVGIASLHTLRNGSLGPYSRLYLRNSEWGLENCCPCCSGDEDAQV